MVQRRHCIMHPVVADVNLLEDTRVNDGIRQIYDAIANSGGRDPYSGTYNEQMPDFSKILTSEDIWNLVKFDGNGSRHYCFP